MRLVSELRRRNVLRMAVLYVVAAWLIMQVAGVLIDLGSLPDWIGPIILPLLALGLPIALIFSWFYELTPDGISLEKDVDSTDSITRVTGRRLDFLVISLLCAAVILFAYDKWWIGPPPEKSIAVLAFENMSGDPDQEYLSDGLSEELLNRLAKLPELRVTSRSSAFSYKGKDFKIADVGRELNVSNVLEGSVRKAGNTVRITAQLIKVDGDIHLWSETYDRSLDNIFAIQDEIASEVVTKLKITLLGHAPEARKTDPEAYTLYLQGRHLRRQTIAGAYDGAQALLQQALEIDPDYAEAWVELAAVYANQANVGVRPYDEAFQLATEALNRAIEINPEYAQAHSALSYIARSYDNDLVTAARQSQLALQLEPANTDIIRSAASMIMSLGRLDEAIALSEFVVGRDPVSPRSHSNLSLYYTYAGRWDDAIASARTTLALSPDYSAGYYQIGKALLFKGEAPAALEAMQAEKSIWGLIGLPLAYHALGLKDESDAALALLIEKYEKGAPYNIAYNLAYRNEVDRAFEWLAKAEEYGDTGLTDILNERLFSNLHNDPRWPLFLESIGKSPEQLAAIEFEVTLPK